MSTILGDVTWTFDGLNVEDCDKTGATFPSDISMVDYQWSGSMNSLSTMGDPLSNEDYNLTRFSSAAHTTIVPDWTKANKLMTSNSGEITASDESREPLYRPSLLPKEILSLIWKFAMTSNEGKFIFTDLQTSYKPNVATGLLRANHEIYHEARDFLYTENVFIFLGSGSDLLALLNPLGRLGCKASNCGKAVESPVFHQLVFFVGDSHDLELGISKTNALAATFRTLRVPLRVKHLGFGFCEFCWGPTSGPAELAEGLHNLEVSHQFDMWGPDFHWMQDMRIIPKTLRMNSRVVDSITVRPSTENQFKGYFAYQYAAATCTWEIEPRFDDAEVNEEAFLQDGQATFHFY